MSYTSFGTAVSWVRRDGQGVLLAKTDIEAAFRLLPVHPSCCYLLVYQWQGQFFVVTCLPMGCAISCSLFEQFLFGMGGSGCFGPSLSHSLFG